MKLDGREWDETVQKLAAAFNGPGGNLTNSRDALPSRSSVPARPAVAPYQNVPLGKLSSLQENEARFYVIAVIDKTDEHLKLAIVSWLQEPVESWLARMENGSSNGN